MPGVPGRHTTSAQSFSITGIVAFLEGEGLISDDMNDGPAAIRQRTRSAPSPGSRRTGSPEQIAIRRRGRGPSSAPPAPLPQQAAGLGATRAVQAAPPPTHQRKRLQAPLGGDIGPTTTKDGAGGEWSIPRNDLARPWDEDGEAPRVDIKPRPESQREGHSDVSSLCELVPDNSTANGQFIAHGEGARRVAEAPIKVLDFPRHSLIELPYEAWRELVHEDPSVQVETRPARPPLRLRKVTMLRGRRDLGAGALFIRSPVIRRANLTP